MSAFKQRLRFRILYNEAGGLEVLSAQQPAHGGALVGFQGGKAQEKSWSFYICKANK